MEITTKFGECDVVYMADINENKVLKMIVRQIHVSVFSSCISETYALEGKSCYKKPVAARFVFQTPEQAEKFLKDYED